MTDACKFIGDKGWTETHTGVAFKFGDMTLGMINLLDIAHSLARTCRYNGHTMRHYSVAEHCIIMARWAERKGYNPREVLTILMHDAAECYIGDLIRPVKNEVPDFSVVETKIDTLVAEKFGTIYPFPGWLKELDFRILHDERLKLMHPSEHTWESDYVPPIGVKFMPIRGRCAWWLERLFLKEFSRIETNMILGPYGAMAA